MRGKKDIQPKLF